MKKSKVIIPALALMAFSVAASITGTVAWFTANRVATVTAGSFAVVNTTTDLSVTGNRGSNYVGVKPDYGDVTSSLSSSFSVKSIGSTENMYTNVADVIANEAAQTSGLINLEPLSTPNFPSKETPALLFIVASSLGTNKKLVSPASDINCGLIKALYNIIKIGNCNKSGKHPAIGLNLLSL